jgi:hypothetical protein
MPNNSAQFSHDSPFIGRLPGKRPENPGKAGRTSEKLRNFVHRRFLDQRMTAPHTDRCEGRLVPPRTIFEEFFLLILENKIAVCRKWRHFLGYRTSDGIHIALQIAQSLPPDLSRSAAKGVPSPARKSRSASTPCHASPVRFGSPAFPLFRHLILGRQGRRDYVNFGTYVPHI